jgi:ABC-2 type transport system permease protein
MTIRWIALRVIQEIVRDRRTLAFFFIIPLVVMSLIYYALIEDEQARIGVVSRGLMKLYETDLVNTLEEEDNIAVVALDIPDDLTAAAELEALIRSAILRKQADGVLYLEEKLLVDRFGGNRGTLHIYVEGSRPTLTASVLSAIASSMDDLAAAMPVVIDPTCSSLCANSVNIKPMDLEKHYLFGSEDYRLIDYFLPVLAPFFIFFFTFIISTITFQRERVRGTLERLMIAPISFAQVILGYLGGFFIFSCCQSAIILTFILMLLGFPLTGYQLLAIVALTIVMMMISLVIGLLASFLAANEFQAMQFIPLVILPQVFLSDIIWSIDGFPKIFQWISWLLPLTHVNIAMRNVMLKNLTLYQSWPQLLALGGFFLAGLLLLMAAVRRQQQSF